MLTTQEKAKVGHPSYALRNEPPHRHPNRKSFPFGARRCRIYRPSPSVMQPGGHHAGKWLLEFERASPHWIEPLMGWTASDDPLASMRLTFATRSAAIEYAERQGLDYDVIDPPVRRAAWQKARTGDEIRPMPAAQDNANLM